MRERRPRKVRVGRVVSDKMDKTVVVAIERRIRHRLYHKSIRYITKFKVHDEANAYRLGDQVRIVETRPLSRTKRWRVAELLSRKEVPDVAAVLAADIPEPEPVVAEAEVAPEAEAPAAEPEPATEDQEPAKPAPRKRTRATAKAEAPAEPEAKVDEAAESVPEALPEGEKGPRDDEEAKS